MKYINFFLLLFFIAACLPEQELREVQSAQPSSTSNTGDASEDAQTSSVQISWLNSNISSEVLSVNVGNQKSIDLIGEEVHTFLQNSNNFKGTYCLEVRFPRTANTNPSRLRVKVIPNFSNNFTIGKTIRFFRVNLGSEFGNDFCNKKSKEIVAGKEASIDASDSNYDGLTNSNDTPIVLKTSDVCLNCTDILTSTAIILYKYNTEDAILERLETQRVSYPSLTLRIDMNSNSDNALSSCSNSDCISKGFNCCVQGQCVLEKGIKTSGVTADPSGFALAETFKLKDALWYKDYPQFYYSCLELPDQEAPPVSNTEPADPAGDASIRLNTLLSDFSCIEELKANALSDPFHSNPINLSASYINCDISNTSSDNYFESVMKRMYLNCGCVEKTNLTTMVSTCPAYTYTPVFQTDRFGIQTSTILSLVCLSPPVKQAPLPFQDINITVSSRTAPHRFFNVNNIEINPTKTIPTGVSSVQEGEEFQYLDSFFIFPKNGNFNINSILGQMNIQLNKAHPAFKVDIEFDKQYLIGTQSGFFQACPTCAKDSWFNNFSAFPFTNSGTGIQPIGYTTRRDTFSTNTSLANYEDAIFGRACFVPPTMLPFSHLEDTDSQVQRLARLKTQATLYINGYQRDWYGFNKGALIGSFDGVTWFSIGKGRIVKSTTSTLYLAINAPFADLSSPTDHIVSVQEYDFISSAAVFDYDPSLEINATSQNEGASCQEWHKCEVDSDCITKLGWEYSCSDVNKVQTNWPAFEAVDAKEISSTKKTGSIAQFLQQGSLPPNSGTKRCVYRGAGSLCRVDYENITDSFLRKNLTCAPNFYCASLDSTNAFNKEVSRFARPLSELVESKNHLFGQDANILGRPKDYISQGTLSALPTEVRAALNANLLLTDPSGATQFGICRPGKLLPSYDGSLTATSDWEQSNQHQGADPLFRTDYISQIAGCNSTLYTNLRYSSCPMLDESGNYINTRDDFIADAFMELDATLPISQIIATERFSFAQNACALEALDPSAIPSLTSTGSELSAFSAFKLIEAEPLSSSNIIIEQTLARDSCLRKPGAVCHTDLDCSPNRLQAKVVDIAPFSFFGNLAEKSYYEEFLVCGQARKAPQIGDSDFLTYNMHNNRCCRPIGETLSMFTEDSPNAQTHSQGLNSSLFGGVNPTAANRYSRYSVEGSTISATTKESTLIRPSANAVDIDLNKILDNSVNITNSSQWKTINKTAKKTCCGGGWIRKFEDGTNDWTKKRLNLEPTNFKCLNYKSELFLTSSATTYGLNQATLDQDKQFFCTNDNSLPQAGSCIQNNIANLDDIVSSTGESLPRSPIIDLTTNTMTLNSSFNKMAPEWINNLWSFHHFIPTTIPTSGIISATEGLPMPWSSIPGTTTDDINSIAKNFITQIPSYVTFDDIAELNIRITDPQDTSDTPADIACEDITASAAINFSNPCETEHGVCEEDDFWLESSPSVTTDICFGPTGTPATARCCFIYNSTTRKLRAAFSNIDKRLVANYTNRDPVLSIDFTAVGTLAWEQKKENTLGITVSDPILLAHRRSSEPGNAMYYLKKLSRLEYLGIPQMTYEPIYCNDNYQKIVPGIFDDQIKTVMDFINSDKTFNDPDTLPPWQPDGAPVGFNAAIMNTQLATTQELVKHSSIFSDNQFQCCRELGSTLKLTEANSICCSGNAVVDDNNSTQKICKLPTGTNLNVYFNKFVSSEGLSTSIESPLIESDFDARTGEPGQSEAVVNKLTALGREFCESGSIRGGGAFGEFNLKPAPPSALGLSPLQFSILDESSDNNTITSPSTGSDAFEQGFRWNHHVYCDF